MPPSRRVYFPIAPENILRAEFSRRLERTFPRIDSIRPDVAQLLAEQQVFASAANIWLPRLAKLSNRMKHEQLVPAVMATAYIQFREIDGLMHTFTYADSDRVKRRRLTFCYYDSYPEDDGEVTARYILLPDADEELLTFMDICIAGVERIVELFRASL